MFLKQNPSKKSSWNNINSKNWNFVRSINLSIDKLTYMLTYCLKCKKYTENVNSKVIKTKNGRPMLLSKFAVCGSKISRFMKEQEAKWLLTSLDLKIPLNKILLFGDILF